MQTATPVSEVLEQVAEELWVCPDCDEAISEQTNKQSIVLFLFSLQELKKDLCIALSYTGEGREKSL